MKSIRIGKRLALAGAAGTLAQFAGCFGSDPQFYFANLITSSVVGNAVNLLFNLVVGGLAGAAA